MNLKSAFKIASGQLIWARTVHVVTDGIAVVKSENNSEVLFTISRDGLNGKS